MEISQCSHAAVWDQHWVFGVGAIQAFVQTLLGAQVIETTKARGLDVSCPP